MRLKFVPLKFKNMPNSRRNKTKERFSLCPTGIPRVYLRTKLGSWPVISSEIVERFYSRAKEFTRYEFQMKDFQEKQFPLREEIVRIAKTNEELLGLKSEKDNFNLLVFPKKKITWDRELLKRSFGVAYLGVATDKELIIKLLIPEGFRVDALRDAISEALIKLGISEKDLSKLMSSETLINVNEKRLEELLKHPRGFKLRPGTKKEEVVWVIKVEPCRKRS